MHNQESQKSPMALKTIKQNTYGEMSVAMFWMKAKNIPSSKRETAYQKCILSYISDFSLLGTAARAVGLKNKQGDGPGILGLMSTLDHAIWFYNDDFDCADWLLYEMWALQVGSGRGIVTGRMFTRQGVFIATVVQEGVIRARVRGPGDENNKEKSKL